MTEQDPDDDATRPRPPVEAPTPSEVPTPNGAPTQGTGLSLRAVVRREPGERSVRRVALIASGTACLLCLTLIAFAPTLIGSITGALDARAETRGTEGRPDAAASPEPSTTAGSSRPSASGSASASGRPTPTPTPSARASSSSTASASAPTTDGSGSGTGTHADDDGAGAPRVPATDAKRKPEPAPKPEPAAQDCGSCGYIDHSSGFQVRPKWRMLDDGGVQMAVDWKGSAEVPYDWSIKLVPAGTFNGVQEQVALRSVQKGSGTSGWITVTAKLTRGSAYEVVVVPQPKEGFYFFTKPDPTSPAFTY